MLGVLGVEEGELESILETCSYIFEQCAYFTVSELVSLKNQLEGIGLDNKHSIPFCEVWKVEGANFCEKLKDVNIIPNRVDSTSWRLHLQLAQSNLSKIKETTAIFQFHVSNNHQQSLPSSPLHLEFNHQQLFDFFLQLQQIQKQLDSLGA